MCLSIALIQSFEQALSVYDGTEETTALLARILQQDKQTITTWARSLGKGATPIAEIPNDTQNGQDQNSTLMFSPAKPEENSRGAVSRLRWSAEMDEQLREAFETSQASNVKETIREIAERFQWPVNAVHNRVYGLKLNEKKHSPARHNREPESTSQEGD